MVHQGLVLELTLVATRVANTIPRFNTHERCLLAKRTPEGYDGRIETDRHFWLSSLIQKLSLMQLALMNLDGVIALIMH